MNDINLDVAEIEIVEASDNTEEILVEATIDDNTEVEIEVEASYDSVSNLEATAEIEIEEAPTAPQQVEEITEWADAGEFTSFVTEASRNNPSFEVDSKNSLRRLQAYYENLSNEIFSGVENDAKYSQLSIDQLKFLDYVEEGIDRTVTRIEASLNKKLTKEAKSSRFIIHHNPFIFAVAKILINGHVSAGKNTTELFGKVKSKYDLTPREELELKTCLVDMGYPVYGSLFDNEDVIEQYYS